MFSKKQTINLLAFAALPSLLAAALFGVCATQAETFVGPSGETWYDPFSWYGDETRLQVIQGVRSTFTVAALAAAAMAISGLFASRHQAKVYGSAVSDMVIAGFSGLARREDISSLRDEIRERIAEAGLRRGNGMPPPEGGAANGKATADEKATAELDAVDSALGG